MAIPAGPGAGDGAGEHSPPILMRKLRELSCGRSVQCIETPKQHCYSKGLTSTRHRTTLPPRPLYCWGPLRFFFGPPRVSGWGYQADRGASRDHSVALILLAFAKARPGTRTYVAIRMAQEAHRRPSTPRTQRSVDEWKAQIAEMKKMVEETEGMA